MSRDRKLRPAAAGALAQRDHIAFGVDRGVLEAQLLHSLQVIFGADLLPVGRRCDFGDTLLFGKGRGIVGLDGIERSLHLRTVDDGLIGSVDSARLLRAERRRHERGCGQQRGARHEFPVLHQTLSSLL
jgi:hypothetical protein